MRPEFKTLDAPASVASGASSALPSLCIDHTIQVAGTFTASVRIEVSNDGSNWLEVGAYTAPWILVLDGSSFRLIRVRTASYTNGAPVVIYGGVNVRAE